jgi:hypothetical protein
MVEHFVVAEVAETAEAVGVAVVAVGGRPDGPWHHQM